MAKTLFELLEALSDDEVLSVTGDTMINAPVVESTDDLQQGGVFVARKGRSTDGHSFIPKAIELGASAIFGEQDITGLSVPYVQLRDTQAALGKMAAAYYEFPSQQLVMVGVTGTDGKTTTSTMIHSILKLATGGSTGYISTIAADIGGKELDTGLHVTTPGAPQLVAINPGFVQGPALDDDLSTSHELYRLMARGIYPAAPRIRFPVCDVRDVAAAHAQALVVPQAAGHRFIIANGETGLFALGQALAAECPDLKKKVPKFQLPDAAVRTLAVFDKRLRTVLPELGREKKCTAEKVQRELGVTLRDGDAAIRDAIQSLRALGLI